MAQLAPRLNDDWQQKAACKGPQAEFFFPPMVTEKKEERALREARAKAVCAPCPVRRECLEYALRIEEPHGIWGGLNEHERKQLILKRSRQAS
jgi:WhiB family redox-sensing transcriptional regulator